MSEAAERWRSMKEITEHPGVSGDAVPSRTEKYNMPATGIGRLWKFRMSDADARMESGSATKQGKK